MNEKITVKEKKSCNVGLTVFGDFRSKDPTIERSRDCLKIIIDSFFLFLYLNAGLKIVLQKYRKIILHCI